MEGRYINTHNDEGDDDDDKKRRAATARNGMTAVISLMVIVRTTRGFYFHFVLKVEHMNTVSSSGLYGAPFGEKTKFKRLL